MKTLLLTADALSALKLAVDISYDIQSDMALDDIPLTVNNIRRLASISDDHLEQELKELRDDLNAKMNLIKSLAVLKEQLRNL